MSTPARLDLRFALGSADFSISFGSYAHGVIVLTTTALPTGPSELPAPEPLTHMAGSAFPTGRAETARFRELVDRHYEFVWRSVRRLGVPRSDVDDAAQEVFVVAARRLADFDAARERAFLFGTAARVASTRRRNERRRPEELDAESDARPAGDLDPEELAELARARPLLQEILDGMSDEVRAVFILSELEELPVREIAGVLGLPQGTVSSRLRSAREKFHAGIKRLQARAAFAWRKR
jgi:RNA polymerase sigma-70 factor (ECF subfamily)